MAYTGFFFLVTNITSIPHSLPGVLSFPFHVCVAQEHSWIGHLSLWSLKSTEKGTVGSIQHLLKIGIEFFFASFFAFEDVWIEEQFLSKCRRIKMGK